MQKIELEIHALSHSITQSHSYAVVLGEKHGTRRLPIVIGSFEAQAIAIAIENITPTRPSSHDLMKSLLSSFQIELREVIINNLMNGVFYAQLVCEQDGHTVEIDSRTSDAIALAARFKCPIYTYEFIMDSAGIQLDVEELEREEEEMAAAAEKTAAEDTMKQHTMEELNELLTDAIEKEDYERAARIRDEITKRGGN